MMVKVAVSAVGQEINNIISNKNRGVSPIFYWAKLFLHKNLCKTLDFL